jgi:predicted patatin/cPLA2 family phospholipase
MRKPKKPKMKKYPKPPKRSASLEVWNRYYEKLKEIDRENHKRLQEYERALKQIEVQKKKKEQLIAKVQSFRTRH